MENTLAAYMAAAIDCDGSIQVMRTLGPARKRDGVRPHYYLPRVTITQVDRRLPALFQDHFDGSLYRYEAPGRGRGYWHIWTAANLRAGRVLETVRPFLRLKGEQADAALELIALIAAQRSQRVDGLITPEQEAQRLALLHRVRRFNARPKATRIRELLPEPTV